ncbi:MAG: tetratricopeptide repeat protein, partial [Pyrinomonadaceae bacterium]
HYAALIHCALGETDESLALLEEAYEQRDAWLVWLRVDPVLAPLRFDPRFMSLVNRVRAGGPPPVADDSRTGAGDLARTLTGNDTARGRETTRRAAGETTRLTTETAATVPAVWRKALAALAALLLFVLAGVGVQRYLRGRVGGEEIKSVAVLPFANLGSDPDTEYLSDGITEHLINDLSRLPSLRVMARATAFTYKGRQVNAREAGREMNVAAVLVGQITKRDDSLVIQAELVNVADGSQIWGERYSRKLSDLPAVQQSIGNEILSQLRLKLTGAAQQFQARHHTEDAEAYQLYLKGEFHRNRATPEDLRRGVEFFKQSIARDPDYALAYAGLALAYRSLPAYSLMPPAEAYPLATAAAHRALSLDSTLAAAHVPLASIKFVYDWDYPGAEWELREALRLNPNSAEIHLAYANFLTAMERFEEAMREYRAAQQLDPLSINITLSTAWSLQMAGRFEEALALCAAALRRDPNHARAYIYQGEIFEQQGRYDESIAAFRKAKEKTGETLAEVGLGHAYAVAGRRAEALQILAGLQEQAARGEISPFWLAVIHAGLGDKDQAFAALEAAYKERSNWMPLIKIGRRLTPLHDDPRFADLLRRVRLAN